MLLTAICTGTVYIAAQEAADTNLQPSQEQKVAPPPSPEPTIADLSQLDQAFKQTSLGKEADERRLHLEWRELANRMANDTEIISAKQSVENARTDFEKRQRLRLYYDLYYGRMRALASSTEMKNALDQLKLAHQSPINQPRVRAATDSGLPTPTPTPKKNQKKSKRGQKFGGD